MKNTQKRTSVVFIATIFVVTGFLMSVGITSAYTNIEATLSGLSISSGTLNPDFMSDEVSYTNDVDNSVTEVTVTPTAKETIATIVLNDSTNIDSGSASQSIPLNVGANTISIKVIVPTIEIFGQHYGNTDCVSPLWCDGSDINHDSFVDVGDLGMFGAYEPAALKVLGQNYGSTTCADPSWCDGSDINHDSLVDVGDLGIFASNYGLTNTYTITVTRAEPIVEENTGSFDPNLGDINHDCKIDNADNDLLSAAYDATSTSPNWNSASDLNNDGIVDVGDLGILGANMGHVIPSCISPATEIAPATSPAIVTSSDSHGGSRSGQFVSLSVAAPQVLGTSTGEVLGESTSCGVYLTGYLKMGGNNDYVEVQRLQLFLNEEVGSTLPISGHFGSLTLEAVNNFQLKYKTEILTPWLAYGLQNDNVGTGYVYKTTSYMINKIKCPSLRLTPPQLP